MALRVGGWSTVAEATVTHQASNYQPQDLVGAAALEFTAGRKSHGNLDASGIVEAVVVADKAAQAPILDLVLFDTAPQSTTLTDNSTLTLDDGDMQNVVAVVTVGSWIDLADNSIGYARGVGAPFNLGRDATTLYGVLITQSSVTFATSQDLLVRVGVLQD